MSMHFMIDFETLDKTPDTVVLSVGCVAFHPKRIGIQAQFHRNINPRTQAGRSIGPDTVMWWFNQSQEARDSLTDHPMPIRVVLEVLLSFIDHWRDAESCLWANSPSFDVEILKHICTWAGQLSEFPFDWRHIRDFRTVRESMKLAGLLTEKKGDGTAHTSLDDAMEQAWLVQDFYERLKP